MPKVRVKMHVDIEFDDDCTPAIRKHVEIATARLAENFEARVAEKLREVPGLKVRFLDETNEP